MFLAKLRFAHYLMPSYIKCRPGTDALNFSALGCLYYVGGFRVSEADMPAIVAAARRVRVLGRLKELTSNDLAAILRLAL